MKESRWVHPVLKLKSTCKIVQLHTPNFIYTASKTVMRYKVNVSLGLSWNLHAKLCLPPWSGWERYFICSFHLYVCLFLSQSLSALLLHNCWLVFQWHLLWLIVTKPSWAYNWHFLVQWLLAKLWALIYPNFDKTLQKWPLASVVLHVINVFQLVDF